jgi:uncharacterized protein (DUF885 family)
MPLMKMVHCVAPLAFCYVMGLAAFAQTNGQASSLAGSNPAAETRTQAKVGFDTLSTLANDFWQWRAHYQPFSQDDIPRIERPGGRRDWSAAAITRQKVELAVFETRWKQVDPISWSVAQQVDYRLMGSAIARVRWELEINPRWQQDPTFYLDQTLTALLEALVQPPPLGAERSREIVERMENISVILEAARENLHPIRPFATLAIARLQQIRPELERVKTGIAPMLASESAKEGDSNQAKKFEAATDKAIVALEAYRSWLESQLKNMPVSSAVGRDKYEFFLHRVALLPYTPEELLSLSQQEWARSVAFEQYEEHRNQGLPQLPIAANLNDEIDRATRQELAVRKFLEEKNILTVPANIRHYTLRPTPDYLSALGNFGELDDFTGPSRLKDDGVRWIPEPSPQLGFFSLATAKDPRPDMVHEGVPGHYFQMCLSWTHPDPIRRHYYDSGANEGLGFYAEEMILQAGLFDDQPRTREIIYKFMRLRALRVEVDVKLALGTFTISQAADYLAEHVPMDHKTAEGEAALFATTPGQAISYQVGKSQIMHFLARSRLSQGDKFDLRRFHDFLWLNGNVPIALQRWEYLGEDEDVRALDQRSKLKN